MDPTSLGRRDYLYLALFSSLLFGFSLIGGRVLTMHESRLPQAAREMFNSGDWLVPKCGGRPWLERPPLPHWITVGVASLFGRCDQVWIVRIPPALMGVLSVLLVAWMAARWFGRNIGLLSGAILATSFQFIRYAWLAEEDIFLAAAVLATMVWFVKLEFESVARRSASCAFDTECRTTLGDPSYGFVGRRDLACLAFFIALGLTNLVKGLLFGAAMVLIPIAGFLLWNADWSRIKRYIWLPGWIAAAVAAAGWIVAASWRHPDLIQLWVKDVVNRTDGIKAGDPVWYYAVSLPWCLVPWTIPAIVGLGLTWKAAREQRYSPERFLWCWAILPGALLSVAQHKHHHYLVPCLAPWAILGALGTRRLWQHINQSSIENHQSKIPFWGSSRANPRWAAGTVFSVVTTLYFAGHLYSGRYIDSYRDDTAFLEQTRQIVGDDQPIFINGQRTVLNMFRHLFYLGDNARMLHNLSFLRDDRILEPQVYVIARLKDAKQLAELGTPTVITESRYHERRSDPDTRWTLFRLKFRDDLPRFPNNVTYTAKQVMEREPGPYLGGPL